MKKKKFNGKGAEECISLDWTEISKEREAQKEEEIEAKVKEDDSKKDASGPIDAKKSNSSDKSVKTKSQNKKRKKKEDGFDIEDVEDGFDIEFDDNGRVIGDKEVSIRKSVDEKIIIKSEELKRKRSEKGFWSKFSKPKSSPTSVVTEEEQPNFRDKKGLDKYRKIGVLPSKSNGPSEFRVQSANWRDDAVSEVNFVQDEDGTYEIEEHWWDSLSHLSSVSVMAIFMALVLFALSVMTTCAYADYKGAQNRWAALDGLPKYKETRLPSYSDRQIDTLEVEMLEAAGKVNQEHKVLSLVLTSVEKDLKIKLVDDADSLVKNKRWGVVIKDGKGNESDFDDEDMDGIIHITGMKAGEYSVAVRNSEDLEGYDYPIGGQSVSVKSKVEYRVIANIREEIKKESEVNVELEDPNGNQAADVESGDAPTDTVEWVESSRSDGGEGYEEAFVDLSMTEKLYAFSGEVKNALYRISQASKVVVSGESVLGISMMPLILAGNVETSESMKVAEGVSVNLGDEVEETNDTGIELPDDFWDSVLIIPDDEEEESSNPADVLIDILPGPSDTEEDENTDDGNNLSIINSVTIDRSSATIKKNEEIQLNLSYSPSNAQPFSVKWSSTDSAIAAVVDGKVLGINPGSVRITAMVNEYYMVYCDVTVTNVDANARVSISGASSVGVGESVTLEAYCSSEDDYIANWSTQSAGIISINPKDNSAVITGLRAGTCVITATSANGVTGTMEITVGGAAGREFADRAQLYDSEKNKLYVYEDGAYRLAKYRDYKSGDFLTFYRRIEDFLYTGWQTIDGFTYYYTADHEKVTGHQIIGGVAYDFDEDGALSKGDGTLGIDVSKYQPSINWNSVKASGISYVIIRCGYRGAATGSLIQDPYFTSHIRGAKNAGLKVGIYFFSTALNETEAVEEASMCAELCSGYGINYPIFIDVESSSRPGYNTLSVEQRTSNIKAFCETISSAGYTPGLYANKTWLTSYIDAGSLNCKIWLAQYNASGPTYQGHYDLWQFTSKGRVDGIDGNVDMDQSYLDY